MHIKSISFEYLLSYRSCQKTRRTKVVDLDKKQLLSSIAFLRATNVSQKKEEKKWEEDLEEIV